MRERNVRFVTLQNSSTKDVIYESPQEIANIEKNLYDTETQDTTVTNEHSPANTKNQTTDTDVAPRRSERLKLKQLAQTASDDPLYEPKTYKQAIKCKDSDKWMKAMSEEIDSINTSNTWTESTLPANRTAIGSRWVFK